MKKVYLLLAVLIGLSVALKGQIFVEETFDDLSMPPDGWSLEGYANQWGISASVYAGGEAPEARFTHITATSATTRLISPEVDLSGESSVMLNYKFKLFDNLGSGYSIGVATRSGGGDWNIVWEVFPNDNIGPESNLIAIDNEDVGQDDFQFCFFVDGNLNAISYLYLDDIKLFVPFETDAEMVEITTPEYIYNAAEVTGTIKNVGTDEITELEISWEASEREIYTTTFTDLSIGSAETYDFTCNDLFFFPLGDYTLTVWISAVNGGEDQNPNDNEKEKSVSVTEFSIYRMPFFEEFTSSTCGPCAGFNSGFVPWCAEHEGQITLLKYQMNWPSPGDPYYTTEGGVRKTYYGVNSVPDLFGNGGDVSTSVPAVNAWFNNASQLPGYISIASAFSLDGTAIDISANILPYQDFPSLRLYVAVFEWETVENTGNNGETEFENVMMKMVPDASGTEVTLNSMEVYEFSQSIDLASTNVEEYDDLGVVIFLQNYGTKEIHQSAYGIEDYVYSADARLSEIRVNNVPIEGFDPDVTDYTVELPEGVSEVVAVTAAPMAGNPIVTYEYPDEIPGLVTINVRAEDLTTTNTYTVMLTLYTSIEDSYEQSIRMYPNPTTGLMYINGIDEATVSVYNISGKLVKSHYLLNSNAVDLSALPNGIYLVKIQKDGTTITKKISLNK